MIQHSVMNIDFSSHILRILRCFSLLCMVSPSWVLATQEINFYYEEQELKPYYMTKGRLPPEHNPGVFIEMLQQVDHNLDDITFTFHRRPWKRCLHKLQNNRADAIIGNHKEEREAFGHYPMINDKVDTSLVVASSKYCLFTHTDSKLTWSGEHFSQQPDKPIAVPQGYSVMSFLNHHNIPLVTTNSTRAGLALLANGRAEGAVTFCETGKQVLRQFHPDSTDIRAQQPELLQSNAYLIFSRQFFQQHPDLVKKIWTEIAQIREQHYLSLLQSYDLDER